MKKVFTLIIALLAIVTNSNAAIVMEDPVIEMGSYLKFVGKNEAKNYKYTLDTYEWPSNRGPQFQLTIEPIDPTQEAQFGGSDLNDPNYWEPLFRSYTKQMAGEEMEAYDNVKRLYVKNVKLLNNQFKAYTDLHIISIEATGNYTIPDYCFQGTTHLETLISNVAGTLTLGSSVVPSTVGFTVKEYYAQNATKWSDYKTNLGMSYIIDSSEITGANISSATFSGTMNGESEKNMPLPNEGATLYDNETNLITELKISDFSVTTIGQVSECYMEYAIYPATESGQQHTWLKAQAADQGNGVWSYTTTLDALAGLQSNTIYRLEFNFKINGSTGTYPNSGSTYRMKFKTGTITAVQGVSEAVAVSNAPKYSVAGALVGDGYKGIVIQGGKKVMQ